MSSKAGSASASALLLDGPKPPTQSFVFPQRIWNPPIVSVALVFPLFDRVEMFMIWFVELLQPVLLPSAKKQKTLGSYMEKEFSAKLNYAFGCD